MKRYHFVLLFSLYACKTVKQASQNSTVQSSNERISNGDSTGKKEHIIDTFAYIQTDIIANKQKYINRAMNVLLGDLKVSPISYFTGTSFSNRFICPDISLIFINRDEAARKIDANNAPPMLGIIWQTPIPMDSVSSLKLKSTNPGEWQQAEKEFYGRQIVKDIGLNPRQK